MSAAETVHRILALVPWLLERPGASVEETAEAFGVDRETVLGDLDTVGYCGLPGLGGGALFEINVVEDRILVGMADELRRPLRLTPLEALRLIATGETVASAFGDELPALRSALDRVRDAVGMAGSVTVTVDGTAGPVSELREAVRERRQVVMRYQGRGDDAPTERRVHPQRLLLVRGAWYLQARDDGADGPRTFRLDRVADLRVTDEPAEPGEATEVRPRYEPGPDDIDVELSLAPGARWIADAVDAREVEEQDGGRLRVRFATDAPRWVAELVLAAAPGAAVVAPGELDERVREEAAAAVARYAPG